ncbi:tetratricopeptide repeat protein, partial [Barnesiella intestinihominis]|uniref:tetratricopeptide repeat protein n=1 Tax=Barnesiella intestinihominis TaxID=487174 RepID=UPI003AB759F9
LKSSLKLFFSLFLAAGSFTAFAASYTDGIEYFKAGQPDRAKILLERTLDDAGTNKAESYYYLGEIAFVNKDYTAAAEYYKKGLEADPLFAYNLVGQGKLALNGSADKEQAEKGAEKYFKEALKGKNKKDAGLNLAIAKAYYETGTPGYEEYMKKSYKADKKFPDYFMFEGDVLVNQQQYGDACGRYENAIYFDPNCIEAYVKYSHIYFDINPTLAIQKLEELQTIAPNSAIAQREMAEAYYKNSQYTKAAEAYEKYMQNPNHFQTDRPRLATLLFYGKRFDESLELAKDILSHDPQNFVIRRIVMYDNYELGNFEAAEQAAIEFLGMNSGDNVFTARDYMTYGDILSKQKKYGEAVAQYEKAYELDNTRTDILKVLSDTYERNKDYVKAIDTYEKYMNADTVNNQRVMDYYLLGQICYSAGQAAQDSVELMNMYLLKADTMFQVVVERSPTDYRGYLWRSRAAAVRDPELKEGLAKPLYEETLTVLDQDPSNKEKAATKRVYIEAYKYLGYYNYLQTTNPAKKNEAIAATKDYWNKMLELDPGNTEILEALKTLDSL